MLDHITVNIYLAPQSLASTLDTIVTTLSHLKDTLTMNQAELQQALVDLKAQADKSRAEVVTRVDTLEAAIAAGGPISAAVEAALADLRGSIQAIDDLNPDAPAAGEVVAP